MVKRADLLVYVNGLYGPRIANSVYGWQIREPLF
jgi:hypothetical protein